MATTAAVAVDLQRVYGDIWIQLTIPDVVPGQPVSFSWSNTTLAHRPLNLGTVTGHIYLLDANGNVPVDKDGNPIPLFTFPVNERITPDPNGQPYSSPIFQFSPPDDWARKVYKVGAGQTLRLALTGSGPDKGPYAADAGLTVNYEAVDATWWHWTVPVWQDVQWKKDNYPMNGILFNRSAYATMTSCVVTLNEISNADLTPTRRISPDQPAPAMIHGSSTPITFATHDFSKSWQWLIEGIWTLNDAGTIKTFAYECHLNFTDEFQNSYMEGVSSQVGVLVKVSDAKYASAIVALVHMETAALLLVLAAAAFLGVFTIPAGVLLAGGAATAAAGAQVAGLAALDPPATDPQFRVAVGVQPPKIPADLAASNRFPTLVSLLQSMGQMLGTVDALNQTESRLYTAISVGDTASTKLQQDRYRSLESDLAAKGSVIKDEALTAAQTIDADPLLSGSAIASGLAAWKQQSTHPEVLKAWVDAGASQELFFQVDNAIRSGTLGSHSSTLGATLGTCAAWLHRVATEIHAAGMPFAGEQAGTSTAGLVIAGSLVQIASAGFWKTTITLINTGTAPALARLNFFDDNGNPLVLPLSFPQSSPPSAINASTLDRTLNAGAGLVVEITGPDSAPTQVGSAQLLTNGNISCSANFRQQIGDRGSEAIVPLENRNARTYALWFDNTNGLSTGVAMANLTRQPSHIEVIIRDDAGAISGSDTLSLPPQGHTSFNLADRFTLTAQRRGTIEFSTQQPGQIGALGLSFNPQGGFTTVPVLTV